MISVSIFILQDVIRQVQTSYKTPYNGKLHTSLSTANEIKKLQDYLEDNAIQFYHPQHENGEATVSA